MSLLTPIKALLSSNQQSFEYECRECGDVFESTEAQLRRVTCPSCGSSNILDSVI